MGFENLPGSDQTYGLVSYDADGKERPEPGGLMSEQLIRRAVADGITDVFVFCHGWKGDMPAAKEQYGKWMGAFLRSADHATARQQHPDMRPLLIGVHWPSQPWGDEELGGGPVSFGVPGGPAADLQAQYEERLGDDPAVRKALEVIFQEARHNAAAQSLPPAMRQAYLDLNQALGLRSDGVGAPPDADRDKFEPEASFGPDRPIAFGGGVNLDFSGLLGPLRQLSYWTMKKRARTIGEGGMHQFLARLQEATAPSATRIHLMGHSFGTIVVSGMVGGPNAQGELPRPVNSLALVQGAVSLWCYASEIPFGKGGVGYFNRILADGKVGGPMITTQSKFDYAVGRLYPLASRIRGAVEFVAPALPEYGGIGTFGVQGVADGLRSDLTMTSESGAYAFEKGKIYNLDGSQFICKLDGASGAHSDIAGPEVAHALWAAALASM